MASDLVTPSVEEHCIIRFPVKEKEKTAVLHRLNAEYGKETRSHTNVYDWYNKFSEDCEEVSNLTTCSHSANSCML
jgi:hypothetical protein